MFEIEHDRTLPTACPRSFPRIKRWRATSLPPSLSAHLPLVNLQWRPCLASALFHRGTKGARLSSAKTSYARLALAAALAWRMQCAAIVESLVYVMCTELAALRRLEESATVRGGHSAHIIRTIVIELNAATDEENNSDDANDSDFLLMSII